jgi:hypothetical protein
MGSEQAQTPNNVINKKMSDNYACSDPTPNIGD